MIEEGWESQRSAYERSLEKVEQYFESVDDPSELIEEDDDSLIRHHMFNLGCYEGHPIFFYDNYGAGIRRRSDLNHALEAPNSGNQKVWIVPADVHF